MNNSDDLRRCSEEESVTNTHQRQLLIVNQIYDIIMILGIKLNKVLLKKEKI